MRLIISRVTKMLLLVVALFVMTGTAYAAIDPILGRWEKKEVLKDSTTAGNVEIRVTWFAAEYIEKLAAAQAEKNLWTESELDDYRFQLLKTIRYDEVIPVQIFIDNNGPSMHMAPFDEQVTMWVGNKKYQPVDYDRRFNFKLKDEIEGLVFFPRFDEKTGESVLEGATTVKISLNANITDVSSGTYINFLFDVNRDDPSKVFKGKTASRLELERLLKRLEKLGAEEAELVKKLDAIRAEKYEIEARVEELQKQN